MYPQKFNFETLQRMHFCSKLKFKSENAATDLLVTLWFLLLKQFFFLICKISFNSFLNFILICQLFLIPLRTTMMRFKYIQIVQNNIWKQMQSIGYLYNFYSKASLDLYCKCQIFFLFPLQKEVHQAEQDSHFKIVHIQKSLKMVWRKLCVWLFRSYFWPFKHQQSKIWSLVYDATTIISC